MPMDEWFATLPVHAEDVPRRAAAMQAHLEGRTPTYEVDLRLRQPDGAYRWRRIHGLSVRDADGNPHRMAGSISDIDARRLAEGALRASEERYSLAMEASAEGHFDVDLNSDELFISERMNEMYGFAPGTRFENRKEYLKRFRFYGNDADTYHAAIRAAEVKGGPERYEFEYRILRPSGEVRWLRTRGKVTRDAEGRARRRTGGVADITEAKLAQEGLLQSQERYALAMEAAADGHTDWNLVTGEFDISPRLLRILGYAPGTTFADRADWVRRFPFHPEDRPRWEAAIAAHFAGRESKFRMDLRIVVRGETRWVAFTFIASRDPAGKPVRWTGTITDINDAKLAAETLRESQERYALAVAGANDGIWDWNLVTDLFYRSPRNQLITMGRASDGIDARRPDEWSRWYQLHPDDAPKRDAAIRAHLEGRTPLYEIDYRVRHQDGTYHWVLARGVCIRDASGRALRFAGSTSNIDARKASEEALRQSEERYALAVAGSDDGVWDVEFAARRVFVSARARELAGMPPGPETVPMDEYFAALPIHPEDAPRRIAAMQAHLAGETPAYEGEFRLRQRDGIYRWRRLHGLCLRDAHGNPHRMAGSISDIDARRRAEEARRLSEERYALAMEVAEEGHFDWNVQTDEIFTSAQALRVMNVPRDVEYRTRADVMARVRYHPDDWPRISAEWRETLAGRALEHEFEYRILRGEEPRWIRGRWKRFRDATGAALRVVGIIADITDRKKAADELRESEARFRGLTALWSDWFWQQDEHLRFTYSSAATDPPDGYPVGSAIGKTRWELPGIVPLSTSWAEHQQQLAERKAFRDFEYSRPAGDGTTRYVSTSGTPIFDEKGEFRGYHGVARTITDRKLAEEARRLSEERYALAMEASEEAHFDWNVRTDEIFGSEA